jgi:branched-subunit amino acid aminotransferase/4-amino-4-deoxychorismate lyase
MYLSCSRDRKVFEDSKLPESNEVILSDEDGNLFEGLSSNFFVILSDGSLQTAPMESVLTGTVMRKVLRDWKFSQIVFENPKISEIDTWEGAFITSTSRLILPIDKIIRGNW